MSSTTTTAGFAALADAQAYLLGLRWQLACIGVDLTRLHSAALCDRAEVVRWLAAKDEAIARAVAVADLARILDAHARA